MELDDIRALTEAILEKLTVSFESVSVAEALGATKRHILIRSADSRLLIGPRGGALQALNHLVREAARLRCAALGAELPDFFIDVNGYHAKRIEELIYQAMIVAERAKLFRHPVELPPMTSYERMIIHSHFADDPDIETASEGEGKFRRVVIKPAGSPSLAGAPEREITEA